MAAGALVTENKSFPDGSLIVGSPAKAVRQLDEKTIAALKASLPDLEVTRLER